jgi:hypothetical protein
MRGLFYFTVIVFFALSASCKKQKSPIYKTSDLYGTWLRSSSSRPMYDSMVVELNETTDGGVIRSTPNGYFFVGEKKWTNITPDDDSSFVYEELGSNKVYYSARMVYIKNSPDSIERLYLEINSNGEDNGSYQYWEKR